MCMYILKINNSVLLLLKPPVNGHPQDQKNLPLKRGVRLWEVKNVVFVYGSEHEQSVRT